MQVVKFMKLRRLTQLTHKHQNQLNVFLKILSKIQHIQQIEDMTVGQDMCQIIWAYHLPPTTYHLPPTAVPAIWKFNTGPTTRP
jgi:hypothetical protein